MLLYKVCNGLHTGNADLKTKETLTKSCKRKYNIGMKRVAR